MSQSFDDRLFRELFYRLILIIIVPLDAKESLGQCWMIFTEFSLRTFIDESTMNRFYLLTIRRNCTPFLAECSFEKRASSEYSQSVLYKIIQPFLSFLSCDLRRWICTLCPESLLCPEEPSPEWLATESFSVETSVESEENFGGHSTRRLTDETRLRRRIKQLCKTDRWTDTVRRTGTTRTLLSTRLTIVPFEMPNILSGTSAARLHSRKKEKYYREPCERVKKRRIYTCSFWMYRSVKQNRKNILVLLNSWFHPKWKNCSLTLNETNLRGRTIKVGIASEGEECKLAGSNAIGEPEEKRTLCRNRRKENAKARARENRKANTWT